MNPENKRGRRNKPISTSEINILKRMYHRTPSRPIRQTARKLNWMRYKVRKALRILGKKPYAAVIKGRLKPGQKLKRVDQIKKLLRMRRSLTVIKKCWWSDESWFDLEGIVHKRMQRFWLYSRDDAPEIEKCRFLKKVMVWVTVSESGVIGPYFFQGSVNMETYRQCLEYFIDELKKRRQLRNAVFMQDGASSHTAISIRSFLREKFPNRVIGKYFGMPWPPYSPDLNPLDFIVWKTLKRHVYDGTEHTSMSALKRKIKHEVKMLPKRVSLRSLGKTVVDRFKKCVDLGGNRL